jgi:hypothetical protein
MTDWGFRDVGDGFACPEGTLENSPTFQRWVTFAYYISPEGTAETTALRTTMLLVAVESAVPLGRIHQPIVHPTLKRWAIVVCPFGTPALTGVGKRTWIPCIEWMSGIGGLVRLSRPSGTYPYANRAPNVETLGYSRLSLRDSPERP